VASATPIVREIVARVFARQDVLDACARRDLGTIIKILGSHGVTQGQIAELTGISQGRLSEWAGHKRAPKASSSFEAFADGLGLPPKARQALGLAPGHPVLRSPDLLRPTPDRGSAPAAAPLAGSGAGAHHPAGSPVVDLASLPGLEPVRKQLSDVIAVIEAERSRGNAGSPITRRAWKNLVFTGDAGTGKSRAAAAVGQAYRDLGALRTGHVIEVPASDLAGAGPRESGTLLGEAIRPASGGILMITAAHDWYHLPEHGRQVLGLLYRQLTEYRKEMKDELAVILAGQANPVRKLLHGHPPLAARFRAVIEFRGFTPAELSAIFEDLADEAGLRLTPAARRKAADLLACAENDQRTGNARLAVRLLNQATEIQARRIASTSPRAQTPARLITITDADIPAHLHPELADSDDNLSGQYL
jgi:transcriptional regulator with XRE-family HTH domain